MNPPIVNGVLWTPTEAELGAELRPMMQAIGWACQIVKNADDGFYIEVQCPAVNDECGFDVPVSWFAFHDRHATIISRVCETIIGAVRNLTRWPTRGASTMQVGGVPAPAPALAPRKPDIVTLHIDSGKEPDWEKYTGVRRAR